MKRERPVLAALLWVFGGIHVAVLLFLAHMLVFHGSADQVDGHASHPAKANGGS